MVKALVVDDSRLQRKIVVTMLERWGMTVWEAASGQEALQLCFNTNFDLVLSDWMMPVMDGLEFCRRFRECSKDRYGYFILLTSKSEKKEVAYGLHAGADDFLTKPVNVDELRARISAGARILTMERELNTKNRVISDTLSELRRLYDRIDADLAQARTIQESLVPERTALFGASRVSLLLKPCGHVGGDLVGMFSPGPDRLGFYNIDVSGHGITSAMVTARVAGYLNGRFPEQNVALTRRFDQFFALRPPHKVAGALNDRLCADPGVAEYMTLAFATVDLATGVLRFVQAGHPKPLLLRQDMTFEFVGTGGLPIGLIDDATFENTNLCMQPGDRLLLYSDGFVEAIKRDGTMVEEEGLIELIRSVDKNSTGTEFLDELYWRLMDMTAGTNPDEDDVSAVLFEYNGR